MQDPVMDKIEVITGTSSFSYIKCSEWYDDGATGATTSVQSFAPPFRGAIFFSSTQKKLHALDHPSMDRTRIARVGRCARDDSGIFKEQKRGVLECKITYPYKVHDYTNSRSDGKRHWNH